MKLPRSLQALHRRVPAKIVLYGAIAISAFLVLSSLNFTSQHAQTLGNAEAANPAVSSYYYSGYSFSPAEAVNYGMMIHSSYYHAKKYPAGINQSIMQKNMDYYSSEDCAHFVSEALIAGGLTALASNPPGDNLSNYQSGFPGSYGIVGVYRLANYLAGYDLPIFPANATDEQIMGYYPTPGSYNGSPHASVFYVTNENILPQYIISPGDVIADGGVGSGHAMLYIGNGKVVQTDPAQIWTYFPGTDYNISFYGRLELNGQNVSAIYIHMPTISSRKSVNITGLDGSKVLNTTRASLSKPSNVEMIASYPDGVGFGNYSYSWYLNGNKVGTSQIVNMKLNDGSNHIEVASTGSNGTAYDNMTINVGTSFSLMGLGEGASIGVIAVPIALVAGAVSYAYIRRKN